MPTWDHWTPALCVVQLSLPALQHSPLSSYMFDHHQRHDDVRYRFISDDLLSIQLYCFPTDGL